MHAAAIAATQWGTLKLALNIISALFGLVGTWLMSKRYAHRPLISVTVAVTSPIFALVGKSEKIRKFVNAEAAATRDFKDSAADMASGLSFLFWAFLIQVVVSVLDWKFSP